MASLRRVPLVLMAIATASILGCETITTGPGMTQTETPVTPTPAPAGAVTCNVDLAATTVACAAPTPAGSLARGDLLATDSASPVGVLQGAVHLDPGSHTVTTDLAIANRIAQAIGTTDGRNADPNGVRLIVTGPAQTTLGTGTVRLSNADGSTSETGQIRSFLRYVGVLQPGESSSARSWQWTADPSVRRFSFSVTAAAPVQFPYGWLVVHADNMRPLTQVQTATVDVYDALGRTETSPALRWKTSNPAVASVDEGKVRPQSPGTATITVSAGERSDSFRVEVPDGEAPTLTGLVFSPSSIDLTHGAATATALMLAADRGTGVASVAINLTGPRGEQPSCISYSPSTGNRQSGTFTCDIAFPAGSSEGNWIVSAATVTDASGNVRTYNPASLATVGSQVTLPVGYRSGELALKNIAISPDTANVAYGDAQVTTQYTVSDSLQGVASVTGLYAATGDEKLANPTTLGCTATEPASGTRNAGTFSCNVAVPKDTRQVKWTVYKILLTSTTGRTDSVMAGKTPSGAETGFLVSGDWQDKTKPSLISTALSPSAVDVLSSDATVGVTVVSRDEQSRTKSMTATLTSPSGTFARTCTATDTAFANVQTSLSCNVTLLQRTEKGTWKLSVQLTDRAGNSQSFSSDQIAQMGLPATVSVQLGTLLLKGIAIDPDSVNLAYQLTPVTAHLSASEASTGVASVAAIFNAPTGAQTLTCTSSTPESGSRNDGTFGCVINPTTSSTTGRWTLAKVILTTVAGRADTISTNFPAGSETGFKVAVDWQDRIKPALVALAFNPTAVDVRAADAAVHTTITVRDEQSKPRSATVTLKSPSGNYARECTGTDTTTANVQFNLTCDVTILAGSESGNWTASLHLVDRAGNTQDYTAAQLLSASQPSTVAVTGQDVPVIPKDTVKPTILSTTITPATLDVTAAAGTITVSAVVRDEDSFPGSFSATLTSPSGNFVRSCQVAAPATGTVQMTLSCDVPILRNSESGTWSLSASVTDRAGNTRSYSTSALTSLGPTTVSITGQ